MKSSDWHKGFDAGLLVGFAIGVLFVVGCVLYLLADRL